MRETSIFTLTLEDNEKSNGDELQHYVFCGEPTNRWSDKALTVNVFRNGTVCTNTDHAPFDGIINVLANEFTNKIIQNMNGKWNGSFEVREFPLPVEHKLHTDKMVEMAARVAKRQHDTDCNNIDNKMQQFRGFGKKWIRSHKLHPDSFIQVALQLSYYRTYGKPAPTYETASLRQYYRGRTETTRSCTSEALAFSKAFLDPKATCREKTDLLKNAMDKQTSNMLEAVDMKACDRHLLALSIIAGDEGIATPMLYKDPAWAKSGGGGNFVLSTSLSGYHAHLAAAVAMVEDGYGVFYNIQPDVMDFSVNSFVSSSQTDSMKFFKTITKTLKEMRTLVDYNAGR